MVFRSVKTAPSVFAMIHAAKPRAPTVIDPSLPAPFRKPTLVFTQICSSNILIVGAKKRESEPAIQVYPCGWRLTLLQHRHHKPPSPNLPFSPYLLSASEGGGRRMRIETYFPFQFGEETMAFYLFFARRHDSSVPLYPVIHMRGRARQHVAARCLKALICVPWAGRNRRIHIPSIYCYRLILYCKCLIKMMQHKCVLLPLGVHRECHLHC